MIRLFNTLSGKEEEFVPQDPKKVGMYVCGPTVYDHAHIGHGRAYVSYDAIIRYLRYRGFGVCYVRNITDIDDKIIKKANQEKKPFQEIAKQYAASFHEDMNQLGLVSPDLEPKASETIEEILSMVQKLIDVGKAYASEGDVYFSVSSTADYGKLSKRKLKDLKAGARVEPGEKKKDPLDFALWKGAKPGEPSWPSPWGDGRPAWHIECSAMAKKLLGDTFDIHAGGRDLIFPHHENEIAQSEGANGKPFAKYWLHNGFVTMDKEKMSKSVGNIITLKDLIHRFHPEALKLYLLTTHYRHPLEFSDVGVEEAARGLDRMYRVLLSVPGEDSKESFPSYTESFEKAMDLDFNTAKAIAVIFDAVKEANRCVLKSETFQKAIGLRSVIVRLAGILGLLTMKPEQYFQSLPGLKDIDVVQVENLIARRQKARREKNFSQADQVRDELSSMGVLLEDGSDGTSWRLKPQ